MDTKVAHVKYIQTVFALTNILLVDICFSQASSEPPSCTSTVPMQTKWALQSPGGVGLTYSGPVGATLPSVHRTAKDYYENFLLGISMAKNPAWCYYGPWTAYDPQWEIDGAISAESKVFCYHSSDGTTSVQHASISAHRDTLGICPANYVQILGGQCAPSIPGGPLCQDPGTVLGKAEQCNQQGNPIDRSSGNTFQKETDYVGIGEFPLRVDRYYNSDRWIRMTRPTVMHWVFSFDMKLKVIPQVVTSSYTVPGYVEAQRSDGKALRFKLSGSSYIPMNGSELQLIENLNEFGARVGWIIRTNQNIDEYYSVDGRLEFIYNASGLRHHYEYNSSNRLLGLADSFGRNITFTYPSIGLAPNGMTNPEGGVYVYDTSMGFVQYPDGTRRAYIYDELQFTPKKAKLLTGIVDENGDRYASYSYNANGKGIATEHGQGVDKHQFFYNEDGSTTTIDPMGASRDYTFKTLGGIARRVAASQPAGSGCLASTFAVSYDAQGGVASRLDFNGTKQCYVNDLSRGLETTRVEGLTSAVACTTVTSSNASLPAGSRKFTAQWHPDWRFRTQQAEPGKLTTWVYNGQPDPFSGGALASCAPSTAVLPDGKPIAVLCKQVEQATTDDDGHLAFAATLQVGVSNRQWSWTYNPHGQMLTAKGPRTDVNDTTTYSYYTETTADYTLGDLQSVTDAAGKVTQFTRYNKQGQVLQSVDPNGMITLSSYDLMQRQTSRSAGGQVTTYTYDLAGQLKRATQPDNTWIGYDYDAAHRLIAVYNHKGDRVEYVLDNVGNRVAENTKDSAGNLTRQLTRVFDPLGRVQQTTGGE